MGFLAGALGGIVSSLFTHPHTNQSGGYGNPMMPADNSMMLAQETDANNELMRTNGLETIKSLKSNEQDLMISEQSSRAIGRASVLSMVTSKHEGLMQSIQSSENNHIKSAFDIVKQA